ncbi:MAG TPA: hypothetical protein VFK16_01670 [Gemmatimonadaceae bacterium]|nr:hypothetical protein [Gemmatimonadaceae bacterium]
MRSLATAILLLTIAAPTAAAQGGLSAGHFGAGFGVSIPTGALANTHSAGFNLSWNASYQAVDQPMGIRGELFYQRFGAKAGATGVKASQAFAGVVDGEYHFQGFAFHPYLIGGLGLYHVTDAGTHPGFNGGVGIRIPLVGMTAYFEARLHKVLTDTRSYVSVPISFGLSF